MSEFPSPMSSYCEMFVLVRILAVAGRQEGINSTSNMSQRLWSGSLPHGIVLNQSPRDGLIACQSLLQSFSGLVPNVAMLISMYTNSNAVL